MKGNSVSIISFSLLVSNAVLGAPPAVLDGGFNSQAINAFYRNLGPEYEQLKSRAANEENLLNSMKAFIADGGHLELLIGQIEKKFKDVNIIVEDSANGEGNALDSKKKNLIFPKNTPSLTIARTLWRAYKGEIDLGSTLVAKETVFMTPDSEYANFRAEFGAAKVDAMAKPQTDMGTKDRDIELEVAGSWTVDRVPYPKTMLSINTSGYTDDQKAKIFSEDDQYYYLNPKTFLSKWSSNGRLYTAGFSKTGGEGKLEFSGFKDSTSVEGQNLIVSYKGKSIEDKPLTINVTFPLKAGASTEKLKQILSNYSPEAVTYHMNDWEEPTKLNFTLKNVPVAMFDRVVAVMDNNQVLYGSSSSDIKTEDLKAAKRVYMNGELLGVKKTSLREGTKNILESLEDAPACVPA